MELKTYLQILLKKWWILVPTFLITLTTGIVFTYSQPPVYSATATYVVVPSASFSDVRGFANGLDILGRREEIAQTFTEIAASRNIKNLAVDGLSLNSGGNYSIGSELRAATNIIEVKVRGPDPEVASALANAVGTATEQYVRGLYEVFRLLPLDESTPPRNPVSPNVPLYIAMAAVLGLVLGGGLVALSEYLETPADSTVSLNIIDENIGIYNKSYFMQRLSKEMIRAKRNRYPLSLALIHLNNLDLLKGVNSASVRVDLLQKVATLLKQHLREEDIIAYFGDETFAILLPDMSGENSKATMEYIQTLISWTAFDSGFNGPNIGLNGTVGVAAYNHNGASRDDLVALAAQALQFAEVGEDSKTYLITELSLGDNHDA